MLGTKDSRCRSCGSPVEGTTLYCEDCLWLLTEMATITEDMMTRTETDIAECPHCGDAAPDYHIGYMAVTCAVCGARGPLFVDRDKAVQAWNSVGPLKPTISAYMNKREGKA